MSHLARVFGGALMGTFGLLLASEALAITWTPIKGVPEPTFGLNDRPAFPSSWTSEQAGFYYVEQSAGNCSDSRTRGYPGSPRCTLPASLTAGAVVAIHGTYSDAESIMAAGTAGAPIFIVGYNAASKPVIANTWGLGGSYVILENLAFDYTSGDGNLDIAGHHNAVRSCSFRDPEGGSYGSGIGIGGTFVLFHHNTVYEQGNWQANTDVDRHGIKVYGGADIWIVDSTFYHCQGDGVQVGDENNAPGEITRVYLGRCTGYENLQSGFWTKNATDVIMSENTVHDIFVSPGGIGQGMGGQYDPAYVWFLFNKIYATKTGIMVSGSSNGGGGPWFFIGNLFYNIRGESCNPYDMGAISYRNEGGAYVLHNTMYDVDSYICMISSPATVHGNIFAGQKAAG
jgi:hypothetical protein